jgi:DNA-binding transcriptional LysR family regulator
MFIDCMQPQHDQTTSQRIVELAHERRRFGYRRIGDLPRAAGTQINDKRVYRLDKLADLPVRKRRGKQRLKLERVPLHECQTGHTAVAGACRQRSSQRYIDSHPAAPCRRRSTPRRNLLQPSGFLTTPGTGTGGRSEWTYTVITLTNLDVAEVRSRRATSTAEPPRVLLMRQVHDVDLKLLRVFDAVVRCGGFSAAQAMLNVGQSTISAQIGSLEVRLGVRLCERGRGGFRLTEQGAAAHAATQRLLGAIDDFRNESALLTSLVSGTLNLGIIDNTVADEHSPLRNALKRFSSRGPDLRINVYIGMPAELEQRVLDGRLHLAVGHFPFHAPGSTAIALYEEVHGLYCEATHPLAKPGRETCDVLEGLKQARIVSRGYLRRRDLDLLGAESAASTADNIEAQAILILGNSCVGFLPNHYAAQWVAAGDMKQLIPSKMTLRSKFSAIYRKATPPVIVQSFLADLERSRRELAAACALTSTANSDRCQSSATE